MWCRRRPQRCRAPRRTPCDEFIGFLRAERGLAEQTICWYRRAAGLFLSSQLGSVMNLGAMNVGALTARDVNAFVLAQVGRRSARSLNNLVTALRALLRFFYLRGYTATPLAAASLGGRGATNGGVV